MWHVSNMVRILNWIGFEPLALEMELEMELELELELGELSLICHGFQLHAGVCVCVCRVFCISVCDVISTCYGFSHSQMLSTWKREPGWCGGQLGLDFRAIDFAFSVFSCHCGRVATCFVLSELWLIDCQAFQQLSGETGTVTGGHAPAIWGDSVVPADALHFLYSLTPVQHSHIARASISREKHLKRILALATVSTFCPIDDKQLEDAGRGINNSQQT